MCGAVVNPSATRCDRRGPAIDLVVGQEGCKQQEEIGNGEDEQAMRGSPIGPAAPAQPGSERDEDRSADNGGRTIDRPGKPENAREQGRRDQKHAVGENLPRCCGAPANDGQHRHARTGVVVGASERQRPEVRWGPQEDDQEQDERLEPDGSGSRRPANHRWKSAGSATDDNVLRRPPLQPDRIHGDVDEDREGKQRRGCDVERQGENGDCAAREGESEPKRFGPRDFAVRDRTPGRARHHGVDVGVVPHVEHTGRAGARGDANNRNGSEQRIDVAWGDEQADGGREDRQDHHAWLHQCDEIRHARGQPGP